MKPIRIFGAAILGVYLGALPFLNAKFAVHNPACPCHKGRVISSFSVNSIQKQQDQTRE